MDEQVGPRAILADFREHLPQVRDALRDLPTVLRDISDQAADGRLNMNLRSTELEEIREQLAQQKGQRFWLTAAATLVVSGVLLLTLGTYPELAWSLMGFGAISGLIAKP